MTQGLSIKPAQEPMSLSRAARVLLRLVLPVLGLIAVYIAAYVGLDTRITWFDVFPEERWFLNPGYWLTTGHLVLPLAWLVLNLTNRRYGAGYALSALLVSWVVSAIGWSIIIDAMEGVFAVSPMPARRISLAFLFAFLIGLTVGITVFDRIRGRTWWGAPLFAALWGQTAFVLAFYPLVYMGLEEPWPNYMFMDLAIKIAAAFLMVLPYYVLRPIVRPLPGFGGA